MKYIYCLVSNLQPFHTLPLGLGGMRVYEVSFRYISALVSDLNSYRLKGNMEEALAHQRVVARALLLSQSVVPCRFGMLFETEEKVLSLLKGHYPTLRRHLTKLMGKVEVGIKAIFHARAVPGEGLMDGERYLLMKRGLMEEADQLLRELNKATSPFWMEVKAERRYKDKGIFLNLCYLVERGKLPSFEDSYRRFLRRRPDLTLVYTGPWPPYSFADIDLRKGQGDG